MKKKSIFWGLFFIAGAVLLLAGKLGIFGGLSAAALLFTILFAAALISSLIHLNIPGVLFSLAFLAIVYAEPLGITAITPWHVLGAALLASIGISMIWHPKRYWNHGYYHNHHGEDHRTIETVTDHDMEFRTSFGESIKYVNSEDLKKVVAECSFGSMKLYFDHAEIKGDEAVIELHASFCGIDLIIPKEWRIVNHTDVAFGGIDEKNVASSTGTPIVTLIGDIKFAGVTILYV